MQLINPLNIFSRYLKSHPILTNSSTCATLFFLGDCMSQKIEMKSKGVEKSQDWFRSIRLASFGFFVSGPLFTTWYKLLSTSKHIPAIAKRYFPAGIAATHGIWTTKVIADSLIFDPPYLALFFGLNEFIAVEGDLGTRLEMSKEKLQQDYIKTLLVDMAVWVPVQYLNFAVIKPRFQPVFVNVVCFFWNTFLSFQLNSKIDHQNHDHQYIDETLVSEKEI